MKYLIILQMQTRNCPSVGPLSMHCGIYGEPALCTGEQNFSLLIIVKFLVQATISEVQRIAQVAPLTIIHRTLATTKIDGFTFPTGSLFLANLSFIMKDPNNFPKPELFDPERFIGTDGK